MARHTAAINEIIDLKFFVILDLLICSIPLCRTEKLFRSLEIISMAVPSLCLKVKW